MEKEPNPSTSVTPALNKACCWPGPETSRARFVAGDKALSANAADASSASITGSAFGDSGTAALAWLLILRIPNVQTKFFKIAPIRPSSQGFL
jgi:hypothetical protein